MIEERYCRAGSSSRGGRYATLYVMRGGTAQVSVIGEGCVWFPCQQDAARWLRREGYRRA